MKHSVVCYKQSNLTADCFQGKLNSTACLRFTTNQWHSRFKPRTTDHSSTSKFPQSRAAQLASAGRPAASLSLTAVESSFPLIHSP